jgi:hypothetical protein
MADIPSDLDNSQLPSWREEPLVVLRSRAGHSRKASWAYYANAHDDMSCACPNLGLYQLPSIVGSRDMVDMVEVAGV